MAERPGSGEYREVIIVIISSRTVERLSGSQLPPTDRIAKRGDQLFRFYDVPAGISDRRIVDLDGSALIECRSFNSLIEAEVWVSQQASEVIQ